MNKDKIEDLQNILLVMRLIDQCHDKQLINYDDFLSYRNSLNDKAHSAIAALLA